MLAYTLQAGRCHHPERTILRGGRLASIEMPSLVGVVEHPTEGVVLFDTGYATHVTDVTTRWPNRLYRKLIPFEVRRETGAAGRLLERGIQPSDVRHVVLSHFHPDHIGGVRDFPNATIWASRRGYDDVFGTRGLARWRRAWFPELLPTDFQHRVRWIEDAPASLAPTGAAVDLFGDGAIVLVDLPGHAAGQVGLWLERPERPVLLAADACWMSRSVRENRPASWLTNLITHDPAATRRTLTALHELHKQGVHIVPAHCPEHTPGVL